MIHYFFEEIDAVTIDSTTTEWLENLILSEGKKPGEINYIFCNDDYLLKVNQDFLQVFIYIRLTRREIEVNTSYGIV